MFKLIGGELKKLLFKPTVYVITAIFLALLIGAYFIYTPYERPSNDIKITCVTSKTTNDEMKSAFDSNLEVVNNRLITKYSEIFAFYNTDKTSIKTIYDEDFPEKSFFNAVDSNYNNYIYLNNMNASLQELEKAILLFQTNLTSLTTQINRLIKFQTQNGYSVPKIIISSTDFKTLENILDDVNIQVKRITEKIANKTITVNDHKVAIANLLAIAPTNQIELILKTVVDINFTKEMLSELKTKYLEPLVARQTEIKTALATETERKEIISLSSKFASNYTVVDNLIADNLYLFTVNKYNDGQVKLLELLNSNIYAEDKNFGTTTFKYAVEENIARNNYIWDNDINITSVNHNFNTKATIGNKTSALDFTFFCLDFLGFFIVLFAVVIASNMIAGEYANGTIRMLAIRPYSRAKIITAKLLATLIYTITFIVFALIVTLLIGIFVFGFDLTPIVAVFMGKYAFSANPFLILLIAIGNLLLKSFVFICLGIFISILFKSSLISTLLGLVLYILGPILSLFLPSAGFLTYLPFVNIDLFQFFGDSYFIPQAYNPALSLFTTPIFANNIFYIPLTISIVLIISSLAGAYTIFNKRDI